MTAPNVYAQQAAALLADRIADRLDAIEAAHLDMIAQARAALSDLRHWVGDDYARECIVSVEEAIADAFYTPRRALEQELDEANNDAGEER